MRFKSTSSHHPLTTEAQGHGGIRSDRRPIALAEVEKDTGLLERQPQSKAELARRIGQFE